MKKIIFIISVLLLSIIAVTWLYFKNLSTSENSSESVFEVIPTDASLIFEYKNENSFYDIFKDFSLFEDVLGKNQIAQLAVLKRFFVDDAGFSNRFSGTNLFFSIHKTNKNETEVLIVAPFIIKQNTEEFIGKIKSKYKIISDNDTQQPIYQLVFSNQSQFYFMLHQSLLIGSFNKDLVSHSKKQITAGKDSAEFKIDFKSPRNKNSIANLYINFSKLPDLLNNFTNKKNYKMQRHQLKYLLGYYSQAVDLKIN